MLNTELKINTVVLKVKGFHPYYINRFIVLTKKVIKTLNLNVFEESQVFLPQDKEKFTLLRSPHVDKKARDQFERTTHKRILCLKVSNDIKSLNTLALFRLLQILSNIAVGVNVEIKYIKQE